MAPDAVSPTPTRTSLLRGVIALFIAPVFALVPLCLLFVAINVGGPWEPGGPSWSLSGALPLMGVALAIVAGATMVLGVPTWLGLRHLGRESGRTYGLAGMADGLLFALFYLHEGSGGWRPDRLAAFAFCSLSGGLIAWGFWRIAREQGARRPS